MRSDSGIMQLIVSINWNDTRLDIWVPGKTSTKWDGTDSNCRQLHCVHTGQAHIGILTNNMTPDLTRADDSDSLSELIIACSDNTMSDRMPDVLSAVIESPNDDTMSRVINPDVHRAERSDTMSNLMSDVLRITDSWPVIDDSDRSSLLNDSDRSSHFEKPDNLPVDNSDRSSPNDA